MGNFFAQADAAATAAIPPGEYVAELCEACKLAQATAGLPDEVRRTMLPLPAPGRLIRVNKHTITCEHRARP